MGLEDRWTTTLQNAHRIFSEEEWFQVYLDHATGLRHDLVPFPDAAVQVLTNSQKGEDTARDAIAIWQTIRSCIRYEPAMRDGHRVLDYGCGWGRITRLLPWYFDAANVCGVDVDAGFVASARDLLPSLDFRVIESMKPLPFAAESFDVVFANSVFSHLSERSARATLAELARITRPGGVVVCSVLEEDVLAAFYRSPRHRDWIVRILGAAEDSLARLRAQGFLWGDTGRWDNYGIAVMSGAWMADRYAEVGLLPAGSETATLPISQHYKIGRKP